MVTSDDSLKHVNLQVLYCFYIDKSCFCLVVMPLCTGIGTGLQFKVVKHSSYANYELIYVNDIWAHKRENKMYCDYLMATLLPSITIGLNSVSAFFRSPSCGVILQGPTAQLGGSRGSFWAFVLLSSLSEVDTQGEALVLAWTSSPSTELVSVLRPSLLRAAFASAEE